MEDAKVGIYACVDGISVPAYNLNVGAMLGDVDISTKVVAGEEGIDGR